MDFCFALTSLDIKVELIKIFFIFTFHNLVYIFRASTQRTGWILVTPTSSKTVRSCAKMAVASTPARAVKDCAQFVTKILSRSSKLHPPQCLPLSVSPFFNAKSFY